MRTPSRNAGPLKTQLVIEKEVADLHLQRPSEQSADTFHWQTRCRGISSSLTALLLAASVMLASGCATNPKEWICNGFKVGPNYGPPPAPIADAWSDSDDERIERRVADDSYWWALFNDPVLDQLVHDAYEQNLPLKAAGMRVIEARARLGVVKGNLFPQSQQAGGSYSRNQFSKNAYPFSDFALPRWTFDNWAVGFDAAWELDFWGRYRRAVESADANLGAQMDKYNDVLVVLQAEVAATYIELRTLEDRLALAQKNLKLQ